MERKSKGNILANTKILNDKTYQDFNKEAPDLKNPNQNKNVKTPALVMDMNNKYNNKESKIK
jgi:hypothetical protein